MTISGREADTLRRARRIQEDLKKLRHDLDEQRTIALRSPSMDGMSGRCADADRMTARLIRIEQMEHREHDMVRMADAARRNVQRICREFRDCRIVLFLEMYYAYGMTMEEACRIAGITQRTAIMYMALVDGEEKDG